MFKLYFISAAPHLSIFKAGANKTNLGGVLILIYIILLVLFAVIYIYDYFTKEHYSYNYTYVRNNTNVLEEAYSVIDGNVDFKFQLTKDDDFGEKDLSKNNNFLIIYFKQLQNKINQKKNLIPEDNFTYINISEISNKECIIKQNSSYLKKIVKFRLVVLYRCNGTNDSDCNIREEDKISYDSYWFHLKYRGYSLEHQNSDNPLPLIPEGDYWDKGVRFLGSTNCIFLKWKLIKYVNTQSAFSKLYSKMRNKNKSH